MSNELEIRRGKINLGITLDPKDFGGAFGLPPSCHISQQIQNASFPKVFLTPCTGDTSGATLDGFRMNEDEGFSEYKKALQGHGITLNNSGTAIPFAFLPESPITSTLTNEYGETFLQKMTDIAGEGMGQLAQMMGARSAADIAEKTRKILLKAQEDQNLGSFVNTALGMGIGATEAVHSFLQSSPLMQTGVGKLVDKLATNHRFDFPQIWRNSTFNHNQTITIRLYNPNPSNDKAHKKYILGPLSLLLLMACPRSDSEYGYNWPLFVRAIAPGYFVMKAGAISSLTIVHGGDQNQLTLSGPRVAVVDIRVELVNLYNAIVDDSQAPDSSILQDKPNISSFLSTLNNEVGFKIHRGSKEFGSDEVTSKYFSIKRSDTNLIAEKLTGEEIPLTAEQIQERFGESARYRNIDRNAVTLPKTIEESETRYIASSRIPANLKEKEAVLISLKEDFYNRSS